MTLKDEYLSLAADILANPHVSDEWLRQQIMRLYRGASFPRPRTSNLALVSTQEPRRSIAAWPPQE